MKEHDSQQHALPQSTGGGVFDPAALAVLKSALARARVAASEPFPCVPFDRLMPPLSCIGDLLDQAWEVLGGSPSAAARFRDGLTVYAGRAMQTGAWLRIGRLLACGTRGGERAPQPGEPAREPERDAQEPVRGHPLVPAERLLPLAAAVIHAARSPLELATLFGSLDAGLTGIRDLVALYDLGVRGGEDVDPVAVGSAYQGAARRALSTPWPGEPGWPGDGFTPPWRGGRPEWPGGGWTPGEPGGWPGGGWGLPLPVPTPGPGRAPDLPPILIDGFEACLEEMIPGMHARGYGIGGLFRGSGRRYEVTRVSPSYACPGHRITLRGTGFAGTTEVRFTGPGGRTVSATPDSVRDTTIAVALPEWAMTGPVWPYIPERIPLCHGRSITVARPGDAGTFRAGRARIARFEVNDGRACVAFGAEAALHWAVEPDAARVIIREHDGGESTGLYNGPGPAGRIPLSTSEPGRRTFSITVANETTTCDVESRRTTVEVAHPPPTLTIVGIEITQGVQRFDLTTPSDPANNSVGLIADMDTVVRVFVASDRGGFDGDQANVTGFLRLGTETYAPINGTPPGSSPIIRSKPTPQRDQIDDSLNFRIPAADCHGLSRTLRAEVFASDPCIGFSVVSAERTVDWRVRAPLPVTIRRIADPHTGDVLSEAEALDVVRFAFDRLPSPATEIRMRPGVFTIHDISEEADYCISRVAFWQLSQSLAYEHNGIEGLAPDPHESVWIGVVFQTGCLTNGIMAWPFTSTCVSDRDAGTAAHEIAHCVGMGHTKTSAGEACEQIDQPVACHTLPNNGAVGEVVFDLRNNVLETTAVDLMSYRGGFKFPHPDHWEMIRDRMDGRF